jgi:hypothetical protein
MPEPTVVFDEAQVAPAAAAPPPGAPTERLPIAGPAGEADRAAVDAAPVANDATDTDTKPITTAASARADAEDPASEALEAETVRLTMRPPRAARAATQRAAVDISDLFDDDDLDVAPANAAPTSAAPASAAPASAAPMAPSITAELRADPSAEPLAASVGAEPGTDLSAEPITAESTSAEPVHVERVSADDADSTVTTRAAPADDDAANQHPAGDADPTVTTAAAPAADDAANTRAAPADGDAGTTRAAPAAAGDSVAVKRRAASEPARIVDDLDLGDTKPERPGAIEDAAEPQTGKLDLAALAAAAVVQDHVVAVASDAITAPIAASLGATAEPSGRVPQDAAPWLPDSLVGDSTPSEIEDDPSDGVVRHHIATAETAPVKRRPPSADPVDDRPGDMTGEITMPRPRPPVRIRYSEPSILIADLGLDETDDDEAATPDPDAQPSGPDVASPAVASPAVASPAVASPTVASPAVASPAVASPTVASPAVASPASTPPAGTPAAAPAAAAASGAAPKARASGSFTATEQAFFDAGRDRDSGVQPAIHESFDDLDEDYRPVGFWERLRGKLNPHGKPQK